MPEIVRDTTIQQDMTDYMVKIFKSIVTLRHVLLYYYKMVGGMTDFTGGGLFGMRDVVIPEWRKKTVSFEELQEAGIERLVAECGEELRKKYVEQALRSMSKPMFLEDRLKREYMSMVIDKAVKMHSRPQPETLCYAEIVDYLSQYEKHGVIECTRCSVSTAVMMNMLEVNVYEEDLVLNVRLNDTSPPERDYENLNMGLLKAIVYADASLKLIEAELAPIMLELESIYMSQEIYHDFAPQAIEPFVSKYNGRKSVRYKGNRCTIHFYLSDEEKAVISFFRDRMPWDMPEPPTDPESLRAACAQEGSPYFIVKLSRKDRRLLKFPKPSTAPEP